MEIVERKETKRKTYWDFFPEIITNNKLKYCGYPMMRHAGKRKRGNKGTVDTQKRTAVSRLGFK